MEKDKRYKIRMPRLQQASQTTMSAFILHVIYTRFIGMI